MGIQAVSGTAKQLNVCLMCTSPIGLQQELSVQSILTSQKHHLSVKLAEFQPACIPSHNRNYLHERYVHFVFKIQHEVTICIKTRKRKVAGVAH